VPDYEAGGIGPSMISIMMPLFIGISGLALSWILLKNKISKTK